MISLKLPKRRTLGGLQVSSHVFAQITTDNSNLIQITQYICVRNISY